MRQSIDPEELLFEERDIEIFSIPDVKARIATTQNYFFPRLEALLHWALGFVAEIYDVDPYENRSIVYKPSNRPSAIENKNFSSLHIGTCGKRIKGRPLTVLRRDGKPFNFHPTYLVFNIDLDGSMNVELLFFRQDVDMGFQRAIADQWNTHLPSLRPILESMRISHNMNAIAGFESLFQYPLQEYGSPKLSSPTHYFPVSCYRGLFDLVLIHAALWPLLETSVAIAEGREPNMAEHIGRFCHWYEQEMRGPDSDDSDDFDEDEDDEIDSENTDNSPPALELDSYRFVKNRIWYSVLARDQWTCCSCGRTPKDGVTLEMDHILPRSRGGSDTLDNLQTLCRKCNSGKSNTDDTDLRNHSV